MNLSAFLGFLAAISVFAITVLDAFANPVALIHWSSLLMVVGGTAATTFVCFKAKSVVSVLKIFMRRIFGRNVRDLSELIKETTLLAEAYGVSQEAFQAKIKQIKDPFLKDGAELLFWAESEISPEEFRNLLETRAETHFHEYSGEAEMFRTIAKFPPAFGLMGTTIGMIALLQGLGQDGSENTLGPSMALALITTLYGLVIANFFLIPVAENMTKQTKEDFSARMLVVEGLVLIQQRQSTFYIYEKLQSYILPGQRLPYSEFRQGQSTPKAA